MKSLSKIKPSLNKHISKNFSYFNNHGSFAGMMVSHRHNNLRVISTPEFPVPYYQRIMRNPPSIEQVTVDLRGLNAPVDQTTVINTKSKLARSSEGLKVLNHVENRLNLSSYETRISSVAEQADIYTEDLIHYLDAAHEENVRILAAVDLANALN